MRTLNSEELKLVYGGGSSCGGDYHNGSKSKSKSKSKTKTKTKTGHDNGKHNGWCKKD